MSRHAHISRTALKKGRRPGVALLLVLWLLAILSVAAVELAFGVGVDAARVANSRRQAQLEYVLDSCAEVARRILAADLDANSVDTLQDDWAREAVRFEVGGVAAVLRLTDQRAGLNVNALSDPDWPAASLNGAVSLLQSYGIGADILAVLSRNGTSQQVFGHDQLVPAKLQTIDCVYGAVEPTPEEPLAICALASLTGPMRVNVNTAPQEVLRAVLDPVARGAADRVVTLRRQRPFASVADLAARLGWSDKTLEQASPLVCVASSWFALQAEAIGDRSYARVFALLHRDGDRVQVVSWRRIR